ncbi:MAG: pyruvate kinase alpha/beta domain-containing protein [Candidatus Heimdallarchaeaceae archaeon]
MSVHFEKPGDYTEEVLNLVQKKVDEQKISHVIIATTKGNVALKAVSTLRNCKVVIVTHQAGFKEPGGMEIDESIVKEIEAKGIKVITATHALAGIDRAIRKKLGTWMTVEIMAQTLKIFGQGTKVCAEIVAMAADAGAISMDNVIAVGGTGRGADTAWIIKPVHTHNFFDMKLIELICKPKNN